MEWYGCLALTMLANSLMMRISVATRLVETLERLLSMRSNPANDQLIVSGMDLVHGLLLLHPASRSLFGREMYMNVSSTAATLLDLSSVLMQPRQLLLDLLDPLNLPAIILSTISALTSALLAQPRNIRTFEACDGLQTITSLFKSRGVTSTPVLQSRINEFLHFYLLPETTTGSNSTLQEASQSEQQLGSPSKGPVRSASNSGMIPTKLTAEKAKLLASYLGGGNGNGNGAARATAADHEADGMMQGLRTGRALGVVVAV